MRHIKTANDKKCSPELVKIPVAKERIKTKSKNCRKRTR